MGPEVIGGLAPGIAFACFWGRVWWPYLRGGRKCTPGGLLMRALTGLPTLGEPLRISTFLGAWRVAEAWLYQAPAWV